LRIVTIKDRNQISNLYRLRAGFKTEHFFFRAVSNNLKYSRFCFSTKGNLANAVLRNKIKRWQKAVFQTVPEPAQGYDILITTLKNPGDLSFLKLQAQINQFLAQASW